MAKILDLTGLKFGKLTAVSLANAKKPVKWLWLCECGNTRIAQAGNVKSGNTQSCGCWNNMMRGRTKRVDGEVVFTHQMSRTREYKVWSSMKDRCCNSANKSFHNYGGRGITVCERWLSGFDAFFADMGPRPSARHSIDRWPDVNGNYEPGNCRWATSHEQMNNLRQNKNVTFKGRTESLSTWSRETGIPRSTLASRASRGVPLF